MPGEPGQVRSPNYERQWQVFAPDEAIDVTLETTFQADKQFRFGADLKIAGEDVKIGAGVNGDKGWEQVNDDVKDMPAEER